MGFQGSVRRGFSLYNTGRAAARGTLMRRLVRLVLFGWMNAIVRALVPGKRRRRR
jgi:hypothetical protein